MCRTSLCNKRTAVCRCHCRTAECSYCEGQVVDEKGEPIIGANVIVEGTTNGMITDLDGNFSLQCPVGSTLKTSYIGYLARTVKVTGNMNALKITLRRIPKPWMR